MKPLKLNPEHVKFVKDLMKVLTAPRNIASCLSNETGYNFKPKDAQNIINMIKRTAEGGLILEEHLSDIITEGGM